MPVTKTRPAGAIGASWYNGTSWVIGRGVDESRNITWNVSIYMG